MSRQRKLNPNLNSKKSALAVFEDEEIARKGVAEIAATLAAIVADKDFVHAFEGVKAAKTHPDPFIRDIWESVGRLPPHRARLSKQLPSPRGPGAPAKSDFTDAARKLMARIERGENERLVKSEIIAQLATNKNVDEIYARRKLTEAGAALKRQMPKHAKK